jgi:hypothetical protein
MSKIFGKQRATAHNYYFLNDFYSFFFLQIVYKPFLRNKIDPMPLS